MHDEILRGALIHISKACAQSTTQTRRIRWIKARADIALEGRPFVYEEHDVPVDGEAMMAKYRNMAIALKEERDALQQRLNEADQRIDELKSALKFYADREHYHFESDNWDTVSGEPFNILWHGKDPDFIEDGEVARSALSQRTKDSPEVGS